MRSPLPMFAPLAVVACGCSCSAFGTSHVADDAGLSADAHTADVLDAAPITDDGTRDGEAAGDAGSPASDEAERFRELCHAGAAIECEGDQTCCEEGMRWFENLDDCLEIHAELCDLMADGEAFARGLLTAPSSPETFLSEWRAAMEACRERDWSKPWVRGALPEGGDCTPRDLIWTPGLGGERPPSDASMLLACQPGLRCEVTGTRSEWTGTCRLLGDEGDSCHTTYDCLTHLHCVWDEQPPGHPSTEGTCRPRRDLGASCEVSYECLSESCADGTCADAPAGWICRF